MMTTVKIGYSLSEMYQHFSRITINWRLQINIIILWFLWNASAFCYQESITATILALFETF
jgi:hypothetical protein